jgi:hypothetical protein
MTELNGIDNASGAFPSQPPWTRAKRAFFAALKERILIGPSALVLEADREGSNKKER